MTAIVKYLIFLIFAVFFNNEIFSQDLSSRKPLRYFLHKKSIHELLKTFDSCTSDSPLNIGSSADKNFFTISTNKQFSGKELKLHRDSIKALKQDIGIDWEALGEIIEMLEKSKIRSVKTTTVEKVKRIELFMEYNFFSENGRGLVYFPDLYKAAKLKNENSKISSFIFYARHISY